jgi:FKBP-type peptidyl-prolyl cis-trans isomerase
VIDGWKIGLPLIKKGGRIKLIIPSALAYSCTGAGTSIPPNTPLYFDVTLNDVK